ncbi:shikimate dehydrogenase [Myxococcota bacterium]|nr:shikimate dehydrogenase [Myxococcota bacterium]MBU1432623.1 shikimate dehydrogenase [Myxococcota bacterium]MBU1899514.1 shikimate dehydrogenase [Myxococcota bacterium]
MRRYRLALIGDPIAHSRSPEIHQRAASQTGCDVDYALWPLRPEGLIAALPRLRALDGFNVTTPLKAAILPHLDGLSTTARRLGAVNTVCVQGGRLWGDNTDLEGFERTLPAGLAGRAVILGAGGAARPVLAALAGRGLRLTILNRSRARAEATLDALGLEAEIASLDAYEALVGASALINTLPREAEIITRLPLDGLATSALVYDLDYRPNPPLLARAAASRATRGGLEMLVYQALAAFARWTGRRAEGGAILAAMQTHGVIDSPPRTPSNSPIGDGNPSPSIR